MMLALSIFAALSAALAGLFGGLWYEANRKAAVWERVYNHLRQDAHPPPTDAPPRVVAQAVVQHPNLSGVRP